MATVDTSGTTSTISYVHADGLNTPRAVTNASGSTVWQLPYQGNPFGEQQPTSANGFVYNPRFAGQYFDMEAGMNYNVNRYYEAATGRFLQSDPIGLKGGPSTYMYVSGLPLLLVDPQGLEPDRSLMMPGTRNWYISLNIPQEPGVFTINGHGNPRELLDESTGVSNFIAPEDLAESLLMDSKYHLGTPIKLLACDAGKGPNSFAQQLANLMHADVYAAESTLFITTSGKYWSGLGYSDGTLQYGAPMYPLYMGLQTFHPQVSP